jgi:deoxyribose-phosphate aldolase
MMDFNYEQIAGMIDHSLLVPTLTETELESGCQLARHYAVASVFVMPYFLKRCSELLAGSRVAPGTTIGFPHGNHHTRVKVAEATQALDDGGNELDMVVNISSVLSERWDAVRSDIQAVVETAHARGALVKVIFENCYLQDAHKIRLCEICGEVNVDWVKTSTGFGSGGATDADLRLMRQHSPPHVQVKAAGGVRSLDRLLEVRAIGVTRVGATRTADILDECRRRLAG